MKTNSGYVIFMAVVAAIGGILFGYDTAVISGTISSVTGQFSLDTLQQGWYVGCALIGSIIGVLFAGTLSDTIGRKKTMLIAATLFCLSAVFCAASADFMQLVCFRIIGGVGIGIVSIVSPIYISEVSPADRRGTMVSLYQLAVTIGFLAAYLVNFWIQDSAQGADYSSGLWSHLMKDEMWRGMLGSMTVPAVLYFIVIFFIPESPRWLIVKGKGDRAIVTLKRIYSDAGTAEMQLEETRKSIAGETKSEWKALLQPGIMKAVIIGSAIAILGQFMGVNAVLYYGPEIFSEAGLSSGDSMFSQVLVGAVNMLTTIIAGILPLLCILLRHLHQRRSVRAAVRNVSQQRPRTGHVGCRACPVGRDLSDRSAHPVATGEPYARRDILPVRHHVHPVYPDHVEGSAGNYRKDT